MKDKYESALYDCVKELLKKHNSYRQEIINNKNTKLKNIILSYRDKKIAIPDDFFIDSAKALNLPYFEPELLNDIHYLASALPFSVMKKNLIFLLQITTNKIVIATSNPFNFVLFRELEKIFKKRVELYVSPTETIEHVLDRGYREIHSDKAMSELLTKNPKYSAHQVLYKWQKYFFVTIGLFFLFLLILNPSQVFFLIFLSINFLYFIINPFKLVIALKGFENIKRKVHISETEVNELIDEDLPVYTILIPVYKEASVIPNIITNINNLDYPKDKLDVKILIEELDGETLDAVREYGLIGDAVKTVENMPMEIHNELTKVFEVLIIPDSPVKTKPRACNYGFYRARGEYIVIYDAEDEPEPDQLKKAIAAFKSLGDEYACLQAHLNFYNPRENLLARWFSLEYSFWFDYWLQGLDTAEAPLPLGGTSNHFQTAKLKDLGAWDPYNVTEDADLGVRISQKRYKTAMLNSYTLEEANLKIGNWIRQRSRWIKGYVQTFLVHIRHPLELIRKLGFKQTIYFILTFGFNILFPLVNPLLWAVTILTILFPAFTDPIFSPEVKTICEFNLILGNLVYIVLHIGPYVIKRNYTSIPIALIIPIYWVLMSYAAWKGTFQLITKPFYWEKTTHGLTTYKSYSNVSQIEKIIEQVRTQNATT